jgi:hypothetical protein
MQVNGISLLPPVEAPTLVFSKVVLSSVFSSGASTVSSLLRVDRWWAEKFPVWEATPTRPRSSSNNCRDLGVNWQLRSRV